jgi:hypothetical protein
VALRELLAQLQPNQPLPRRFRLHPVAWAIAALWLFLVWGSALILRVRFVGAALETTLALLIALGLAFIPFIHNPARRLIPSLLFCAVLIADASWLVLRNLPSKVERHEFALALETRVCRKIFACSPSADAAGLVAKCVQGQMQDTGFRELLQTGVDQQAWDKCESLECEAFSTCFDREAGLLTLAPDQKRRLLRLICEAIQDESRRSQVEAAGVPSSTSAEMERALGELQNPPLAAALTEEARKNCPFVNGTELGTADRMPR